jgi:hypothetical protein
MALPVAAHVRSDSDSGKSLIDSTARFSSITFHVTQVNFNGQMGDLSWRAQEEDDATYLLVLLAIGCATMTSGFAGVYIEKINQKRTAATAANQNFRSFQLSIISKCRNLFLPL